MFGMELASFLEASRWDALCVSTAVPGGLVLTFILSRQTGLAKPMTTQPWLCRDPQQGPSVPPALSHPPLPPCRPECRVWTAMLLLGTCLLYCARVTVPICAVALSSYFDWDKKQFGVVLSSFFWGYCLTQIVGGHISDQYWKLFSCFLGLMMLSLVLTPQLQFQTPAMGWRVQCVHGEKLWLRRDVGALDWPDRSCGCLIPASSRIL